MRIHQVLHGYAEGHRQLASSVVVKARDTKTMLFMSDSSGPGVQIPESGYLTGYPLPDSGLYALARTWPAPEMPRPGCVWTHTLLIDYGDLATLSSFEGVFTLFHRPESQTHSRYQKPAPFSEPILLNSLSESEGAWAQTLLAALYGAPTSKIIAARPTALDEEKVISAIWAQQWPRLRRSFRFCTLTTADRSTDSGDFDLQLYVSSSRAFKTQGANLVEAARSPAQIFPWLQDAYVDLMSIAGGQVRSFLKTIGSEVQLGREAFGPLCELHRLIRSFDESNLSLEMAISIVEKKLSSAQSRTVHALIVDKAISVVNNLNDFEFDFLIAHLDLVDATALKASARNLGEQLWRRDFEKFVSFLESDELRVVANSALASIPIHDLVDGVQREPKITASALLARPELVIQPAFWRIVNVAIQDAMDIAAGSRLYESVALEAILHSGRIEFVELATKTFGSAPLLRCLASMWLDLGADKTSLAWLYVACRDRDAVAEVLTDGAQYPIEFWVAISKVTDPDHVSSDFGVDPWLGVIKSLVNASPHHSIDIYLHCYLLSRAFGNRTSNASELAMLSFDPVHKSATYGFIPNEAWGLVDGKLPSVSMFFDWDKGLRIRAGIVNLFIERGLAPMSFAFITSDDHVFELLIAQALRLSDGKKYVKAVLNAMKDVPALEHRADQLRKKIKS